MEREEIFGAIIVLIIIIVVALIVFQFQGEAGEDIKRIANEVFGISKAQLVEEAARASEADAATLMDRLTKIYGHSLTTQRTNCTYDLRGYKLPETYKIEVTYLNKEGKVVKLSLLQIKEEKLISSQAVEDKEGKGGKLEPCYMKNTKERETGGNIIPITYTIKEGLKVGTYSFYEEVPKLYKYEDANGKTQLCFITKARNNEKEYQKYFMDAPDCESGKATGAEKAKDFFNSFMASIKRCRSFAKNVLCQCDPIDFENMPAGAKIYAALRRQIDEENSPIDTAFSVEYNDQQIATDLLPNTVTVDVWANYFDSEPRNRGIGFLGTTYFTKDTNRLYLVVTKANELGFATERAAWASGALRWIWAEPIPTCGTPYETLDESCKRKLDPQLIIDRLTNKDNKYDQAIMKATSDKNQRLLLAAIIATESDGINDNRGDSAGLMQITEATAKEYNVCDTKGCDKRDDRRNPGVAIPAGLKILQDKISYIDKKCPNYLNKLKQYTFREIFGVAAYNGGQDVICKAIQATKKEDPTWDEVKSELTVSLMRSSKGYSNQQRWTKAELEKKIGIIKCYATYVEKYRTAFTGRLFEEKTVQQTVQQTTPEKSQTKISSILIDPGHGGNQPGAVYGQLREADANLATALKLRNLLLEKYPGIKVDLTRTTDIFVDLNERARMASSYDLFISVHYDSAKTGKALIYYPSKNLRPENLAFAKELAQKLGVPLVPSSGSNYPQLYIDNVKEPTLALLWEVDSLDKYSNNENYIVAKDTQVINFLDSYMA